MFEEGFWNGHDVHRDCEDGGIWYDGYYCADASDYEEAEMEYRFRRHGYDNILLRGPRIIHLEGEGGKDGKSSKFLRDCLRQQKSEYIYFKLTRPRWKYLLYRIGHPLLRQTLWLNPNVTVADKWKVVKQLFTKTGI